MTTSIVFCRDCKYEPISFNKQACPQCGGRNFEARYPVSQAETLEPIIGDKGGGGMSRNEGQRVMEAGRELDALVAEKVMGWALEHRLVGAGTLADPKRLEPEQAVYRVRSEADSYWQNWSPDGADRVLDDMLPRYSTDIAAAWDVVEWLHDAGKLFVLWATTQGRWIAQVFIRGDDDTGPVADKDADTAPRAICLAALQAVDVVARPTKNS